VRWGQNFLADASIAEQIVDWARIDGRAVLEIGPGRGALTEMLAARASHLDLVEIDPLLVERWTRFYADRPDVRVHPGDVLALDLRAALDRPVHVVANLPYESGTAIVAKLLELGSLITEMVVMLQREVCNRLVSAPDTKAYGVLTIHTALRADVEAGIHVPPSSFRPAPKVDSQVLRLRPLDKLRFEVGDLGLFTEIVKRAFANRRKMLRNTLGPWLAGRLSERACEQLWASVDLDDHLRPEHLSVEDFARLSSAVHLALQESAGTP
jgi:16S rRNA (adenine1518-N6/adenine1519-N6)-dimethyltransferase